MPRIADMRLRLDAQRRVLGIVRRSAHDDTADRSKGADRSKADHSTTKLTRIFTRHSVTLP
jgi:hypothetical protein